MNKCVLILCTGDLSNGSLQEFLKKEAQVSRVEGLVQPDTDGQIKIVVSGDKDDVDQFLDVLYDKGKKYGITDIEVEPYFKHKDFRGVFRIVS